MKVSTLSSICLSSTCKYLDIYKRSCLEMNRVRSRCHKEIPVFNAVPENVMHFMHEFKKMMQLPCNLSVYTNVLTHVHVQVYYVCTKPKGS